jgi:eukaryotic-like serine/threonine-protein kinase
MGGTSERLLGNYRLLEQLAVGGMAEIYVAKTHGVGGFEKAVALKVIHPNYSQDPEFVQMLVDEAKLAVQLQHANIVQTFDLGCVEDQYYIAMELIDGIDLYKLLRRASEKDIDFPFEVAAFIAQEICNGLDYAHQKRDSKGRHLRIVHRDISPQNILVSFDGEVKIVDFGIAKAALRGRQTAAGVIKGKYYYMSPEQAWGDPIDLRTDVFSAGIILYEMLIGQMLYLEDDIELLLDKVRKANIPPPSTKRSGVPMELELIVMSALRKRATERYQSAGEFAAALTEFLRAFAPEFTRAKLAAFAHQVLGDEPTGQTRDPKISTAHTREMLEEDENSLIFKLAELKPDKPNISPVNKPAPKPAAPKPAAPVAPRGKDQATSPVSLPELRDLSKLTSGVPAPVDYEESDATIVDPGLDLLGGLASGRASHTSDEETRPMSGPMLRDLAPPGGAQQLEDDPARDDHDGPSFADEDDDAATLAGRVAPDAPSPANPSRKGTAQAMQAVNTDPGQEPRLPGVRAQLQPQQKGVVDPARAATQFPAPRPASRPAPLARPAAPAKPPRPSPSPDGARKGEPAAPGPGPSANRPPSVTRPASPAARPTARPGPSFAEPDEGTPITHRGGGRDLPEPDDDAQTGQRMAPTLEMRRRVAPAPAPSPSLPPTPPPTPPPTLEEQVMAELTPPTPPVMPPAPMDSGPTPVINPASPLPTFPSFDETRPPPPPSNPVAGAWPPPPIAPMGSDEPTVTPSMFTPPPQGGTPQMPDASGTMLVTKPGRTLLIAGIAAGVVILSVVIALLIGSSGPARATIEVVSLPPGAEVRLDGTVLSRTTPLEITDVDAQNPHHVRVSLRGHDVWESDVKFTGGARQVRLQAVLVPTVGSIVITSVPPGAEAIVNDRIRGATPVTVGDLPPNDDVNIELRLRGYKVARKTVSFAGKRKLEVPITLEKAR